MSHAVFIWSAYAVALVCLGGLVIASVAARRRARRELAARGLERIQQFTWANAARATAKVYAKVLGHPLS
jgi:heme exporter protein CcmD